MAMTLEKLKKLLADGVIDQTEYDESLEKFGLKDEGGEDDPLAALDDKTKAAIQKMIQSERDRTANKLGNQNKTEMEALKEQLEKFKKEKLTDEERKAAEAEEQKAELERQKREFQLVQNKYTAVQALKKAGLDNDDEIVELVLAADAEGTNKNVASLAALVDRLVKAKVEEKFKEGGRVPGKGSSGSGTDDNPWMEGHINYSRQMEIEAEDPEKAKLLMAAANKK